MSRVVLASGNAGKLREFSALLAPLGLELLPQSAFGLPAAEEPFGTFLENALAKARHASRATGLPALADDSGICVEALGGRPGVWSARWAAMRGGRETGDADAANNARLVADLAALAAGGAVDRTAHYYCVLVLVRSPDDPQPLVADGSWYGEVIDAPRGTGGFGYDPHFLLPELGLTVAELDAGTKNRLSHRGKAMRALAERLREARLAGAGR
ncbi:RdgB/HAM1 family non-canonical purine NTP pyrophosphatase [Burkholderiaceae bacterium FT117]|uniref:RdgB/HAM1 family non-canonical purine NTP pyrophosphatase n=1 Tax=Zeimonas sediminis TaxID=2944268 RepID=UPI002342E74D|nr:RdgB/HAM1 family non-canonical purine NTP pyrophosphatase [Zeimonas sediminis]MCM5571993.1 RdgB/HAM1 family non-canonical purine NTP pyrophosphatase [Zeimonas sediminis]